MRSAHWPAATAAGVNCYPSILPVRRNGSRVDAPTANSLRLCDVLQPSAHAYGVKEGCAFTSGRPAKRDHYSHARSVGSSSSIRADMIFGKDNHRQTAPRRTASSIRPELISGRDREPSGGGDFVLVIDGSELWTAAARQLWRRRRSWTLGFGNRPIATARPWSPFISFLVFTRARGGAALGGGDFALVIDGSELWAAAVAAAF